MNRFMLSVLFFLCTLHLSFAQSIKVPIRATNWTVNAQKHQFETHKGKQSLFLQGGIALLNDESFENGIIEFDISFALSRKFVGFIWRIQDGANFEEFYMRPHQSGNPDANQYTPVFNGIAGWQLYHGEGYGKPFQYRFDEWMHVKIAFSGNDAEIYIDDMENPLFRVNELKHKAQPGSIGFRVAGPQGGAHFANLTIQKTDQVTFKAPPIKKAEQKAEQIKVWEVSEIFNEKKLEGLSKLSDSMKKTPNWQVLKSEANGTVNLARINTLTQQANTVFVKCTIRSSTDQLKRLDFGYSDRVKLFCNDQLLYAGNNSFRSRDYRYLGTIGHFDAVYLPLQKGENEVWIAVSENFGGWGLSAQLEDLKGIEIIPPTR